MAGKTAGISLWPEMFRFGIYKSSQGRMVRQFSFFAVVVLAAFGCISLHNGPLASQSQLVQLGIPLAIWGVVAWIAFRAVNVPRIADFLVSVEAELEKVTWPLWKEVVQATVVVISTMLFVGSFLFVVDIIWRQLFQLIGFVGY